MTVQPIFDKDDIVIQKERTFFSTNGAEAIGLPCDRKKESKSIPLLSPHTQKLTVNKSQT